MAAGKLYKDIPKMKNYIHIIEQYNNYMLMGANDDIEYIKQKIENLINIKDSQLLIEEFNWCSKIVNSYYNVIDPSFKKFHY